MLINEQSLGLAGLTGLRCITTSRNSRLGENSHSDERQEVEGYDWAIGAGMVFLGYCEDTNIPGGVDPWDRDELGPWLQGDKGEFDAIVASTVDRISRDFDDFCKLRKWCIDNEKRLIVVQFGMDLASKEMIPFLIGNTMATFADVEHRLAKRRLAKGRKTSLDMRKALGLGQMPYWCQEVGHDSGKGGKWVLHPDRCIKTMEMIEWVESGKSRTSLAKQFNAEGRPIPRAELKPDGKTAAGKRKNNKGKGFAGQWGSTNIKNLLDNRMLIGEKEIDEWGIQLEDGTWKTDPSNRKRRRIPGRIKVMLEEVPDGKGGIRLQPVPYIPPLLVCEDGTPDVERFENLRVLLNCGTGHRRSDAKPLAKVVFCFKCGDICYATNDGWQRCSRRTNAMSPHYGTCDAMSAKTEKIMALLENDFLSVMGDRELSKPVFHPPSDFSKLQTGYQKEYDDLFDMLRTAPKLTRDRWEARLRFLESEIARLDGLPVLPARTEWLSTGTKLAEVWSGDWHGNGNILRSLGIKVLADKYNTKIWYPEDIDARLQNLDISCDTLTGLNQDHTFSAS